MGNRAVITAKQVMRHCLAEQIAEEVYEMFEPVSIDEPGALGECWS